MSRAAGALLRCRYTPPTWSSIPGYQLPAGKIVSQLIRRRQLHSTSPSCAGDSSNPAEKVDEAAVARLLEQFEGTKTSGKTTTGSADPDSLPIDERTPTKAKRKSKIEDYSAWHGWDGETDKGPARIEESGDIEVNRYIADVLTNVAKSKAAREKAAEDVMTAEEQVVIPQEVELPQDDAPPVDSSGNDRSERAIYASESTLSAGSPKLGDSISSSTAPSMSSSAPTGSRPSFSKADMSVLAKKLQNRLDEEIKRLKLQKEVVKQSLTTRAREFGKDAQVQFGLLGGKVNGVTGYDEIERLKQKVRERENDIARLREDAARAKHAYDSAVTAQTVSQRDLNSLLERKQSWTDADISSFTHLVRSEHNHKHAVAASKEALEKAEAEVDKAFTALLKSILERYHEEQVWSDKIRSVSTYGSLIVLLINLVVFLGAIAIVEPWKRKRLVRGLEERVKGMVEDVEHTVTGEFEEVKRNMASVAATLAELQAAIADEESTSADRIRKAFTDPTSIKECNDTNREAATPTGIPAHNLLQQPSPHTSSLLSPSALQLINRLSSATATFIAEQDPHRVDMAIVGTVGLFTGAAATMLISAFR